MTKYLVLLLILLSFKLQAKTENFCKPRQKCWPAQEEWKAFAKSLSGKLEIPQSVFLNSKNPFAVQEHAGLSQFEGWLEAWQSTPSAYAVHAENVHDIIAAVNFARKHHIRPVVKGGGHDYLGRSTAPDSLLVWTHKMRKVVSIDSFIPKGCSKTKGVPALSVEAGARWIEAYQEATIKNGVYVQGGGCTSVGAAGGFIQGGGFGSFSRKFGTGAANVLEAEIVTADGRLLTANSCQNQDLFWAISGGGGGTFGIVSKIVMRTHTLPTHFTWVKGRIDSKNEEKFSNLLFQFFDFYSKNLLNENWGEQVRVSKQSIDFNLSFVGREKEAQDVWKNFRSSLEKSKDYSMEFQVIEVPGRKMWDYDYIKSRFPGAVEGSNPEFWWTGDSAQVGTSWYAYQSRWLPMDLFKGGKLKQLASILYEASRHWSIELHFNKGLGGASSFAREKNRATSMHPKVLDAGALLVAAAHSQGKKADRAEGALQREKVGKAMKVIYDATKGSGTYVNEADYFEKDWQNTFWGSNYKKLLAIKKRYDTNTLFVCHHCVE